MIGIEYQHIFVHLSYHIKIKRLNINILEISEKTSMICLNIALTPPISKVSNTEVVMTKSSHYVSCFK